LGSREREKREERRERESREVEAAAAWLLPAARAVRVRGMGP
jgi:hypothetical protein